MVDVIDKYMLNDGHRLVISYDMDAESPREWDNTWKLCIKKHRRHNFPNELDFDFDEDYEDYKDTDVLEEEYHIFWLECYEHSWIVFSLAGTGMQCQFDTAEKCGFIAIPKNECENIEDAKQIAGEEIEMYNKYLNGEVYRWHTEEKISRTTTNSEWDVKERIEREYEDGCWWYYDIDDILNEFKPLEPKLID